jgi:hypothetical protein
MLTRVPFDERRRDVLKGTRRQRVCVPAKGRELNCGTANPMNLQLDERANERMLDEANKSFVDSGRGALDRRTHKSRA